MKFQLWGYFGGVLLLAINARGDGPVPVTYQYEYAVKDSYSGQDFGQTEARNGYNTQGGYEVQLPDGRRQIVTYSVKDPASGYVADVKYQGEPVYADQPIAKSVYVEPIAKPAYVETVKPAYVEAPVAKPVYKPKPAYIPKPSPSVKAYAPAPFSFYPSRAKPVVEPIYSTEPPTTVGSTYSPEPAYSTEAPVTARPSYSGPTYIPQRLGVGDLYYKDTLEIAESRALKTLFMGDVKEKMVPSDSLNKEEK